MASRVVVALRVKASPLRAFEAFTAEIGQWWKPNSLFAFTPRAPGVLSFDGHERLIETREGGKVFEVGRVSVWEPGVRLVLGWRQATFTPDMATEVEVTFEAVGEEETRVTVSHSGWDSVPTDHLAKHGFPETVFLARHGEWWRALLGAMREYLG
ncbi:MAG: SRPBCC domain-containing protein [Caulobacter sp.]|nr:SRPBCC domain-containing protein [Caulobacter sp.]